MKIMDLRVRERKIENKKFFHKIPISSSNSVKRPEHGQS